jgi:hypothetical protein
VDPSGRRTTTGFCVGCLLWHGTAGPLKCPVVPVSAIAIVGGAEPRDGCALCVLLIIIVLTTSLHSPGVPRSYSITGTTGVSGVPVITGGPRPRPRPPSRPSRPLPPLPPRSSLWWKGAKIRLHPFCVLVIVALLMCPSLGFLQFLPMCVWLTPWLQQ